MKPKISIITPSFNQGQFLEKTILSVINQNYSNLEYIIIDGGSTDNSVDIIKKYENHLSYWISEKDKGQTHAINKGLQKSTGQILNWINSDDYLLPNSLNSVANSFSCNNSLLGFVYGACQHIDSKGNLLELRKNVDFDSGILRFGRNLFAQPASFFHRRVIDSIGLLDETLNFAMDYEFWIRSYRAGFHFKNIDTPLAAFRFHGESKTVGGRSKQSYEYEQVMLSQVLNLKNNHFNIFLLRAVVSFFRFKNVILRGLQKKQWSFRSVARARKKGKFV